MKHVLRTGRVLGLTVVAALVVAVPAAASVFAAKDAAPNAYDGTAPQLTVAPVQFVLGASIDAATPCTADGGQDNNDIPLRLTWTGSDAVSGVAGYEVWEQDSGFGSPPFQVMVRPRSGTTTFDFTGYDYSDGCTGSGGEYGRQYFVVATDGRGNGAFSNKGSWDDVEVREEATSASRTGVWKTAACACFNNGTTTYSTVVGASITYQVDVAPFPPDPSTGGSAAGRNVALVMPKAPDRGTAKIVVDGRAAASVSTYANVGQNRVIVWQQTLTPGKHTIKITNAGTSGHGRIDVDALLLTAGQLQSSAPACNTPATGPAGC